jgi:tRNA A-37 threonylcarbamoyl transferase component Bud32
MDRNTVRDEARAEDGAAASDVPLSRYELVKELGHGGMARVWAVREQKTGRALALKRLSASAARRHVTLFEREYYTLAGLHHPSIVEVYDYAIEADGPYYTMELLSGSDLSNLVPLPFMKVCQILRDTASALALLHARRFLHRDVSARNVWLTPEGRVKLIDFGTLVPFGRSRDVAGTPPFVAPEALQGHELDQRTDLYALGALGYYLLTGAHAFPARALAQLPELWQTRPPSASLRVHELGRADLPELPPALDALLERMLGAEPRERPHSAAEVIDALCTIAGLPGEGAARVPRAYLSAPALTGRERESHQLSQALSAARAGRGAGVLIEGAPRVGKTRMLTELALMARIASGIVLQVEADSTLGSHSLAERLSHKLLDVLPAAASGAAQPYASTLAHLSSSLRERLGLPESALADLPRTHGEARMRVQAALSSWFLELMREHCLVLLVDDFQQSDAASAAWLTSLVRQARTERLLVVSTIQIADEVVPHVEALRRHADVLKLAPLTAAQIAAMLQSVFGEAMHLPRLADLVAQRSEGNPGHALDLVEHLVEQGLLQYGEGTWVLPPAISEAELPRDPQSVLQARLSRLPEHARALAQVLSVREGLIPFELCTALAEVSGAQVFDALQALVAQGVLSAAGDAYRFEREPVRQLLLVELSEHRKRRAHAISGEYFLSAPQLSPLDRLRAGLHLVLGGDVERGSEQVAIAAKHYGLVDLADVGQAAPTLERALAELRALGRPEPELLTLYAPLALAGYYFERQYSDRYADQTIALLERLLGLTRARRLQAILGQRLGLWISLGWSALQFRRWSRNGRAPTFREAMMLLFYCVAASTGVSTVCIDPQRAQRFANVLAPLRALGRDHVAKLMHDFCLNLAATVRDGAGETRARWQRMIERLESTKPISGLTSEVRILYLAGALYACGVIESWRDTSKALQLAQRLEDFKLKLYELSANQIRMLYHAHQGNHVLAERFRERVEVHAIQRGTAWQADTWSFSALIAVYLRTHNVLGLKYCAQQLMRTSQEVRSLEPTARRAQGSYLMERGSPDEALTYLSVPEEPLALAGWARSQGVRARALNALGQHAAARKVCMDTLRHLTEMDLELVGMSLNVQIELALAEAGHGSHTLACEQLDGLIKKFGALEGPLTMTALHEARAQVALLHSDAVGFEHHLACLTHWARRTTERALVTRGEHLRKVAHGGTVRPLSSAVANDNTESRAPDLSVLYRLQHGGERTLSGSAEWILDQLIEFADVRACHVFVWHEGTLSCAASHGELPDPSQLAPWLRARLDGGVDGETVSVAELSMASDADRTVLEGRSYRMLPLMTSPRLGGRIVGALVIPDEHSIAIPHKVLLAMADRLHSTLA